MRPFTIYFFLCFAFSISARSQQLLIDSLVHELSVVKNDTIKARLYKGIVEHYSTSNPDEAFRYAMVGMNHVKTMGWEKGVAVFNNLIGTLESDKGNYQRAIEHFRQAYTFHIGKDDFFNAASSLNNWGSAYQRQSVFDQATNKFFEALKLAEQANSNYLRAICLSNIAKVYSTQGDFDKSLEYDFKALDLHKNNPDKRGIGETFESIGNTYLQKKDTVQARKYYGQALDQYDETENKIGLASSYTNMSHLFRDSKNILDYRLKAQRIWDEVSPSNSTSILNLGNIVFTYLDMVRHPEKSATSLTRMQLLEKAEAYLNRAVVASIEVKDRGAYAFLIGARSELEAEKGNYKQAYQDAILFRTLNDSIYSQENKNKIAAIETQREVAIRDREIELNKKELLAKRNQLLALIAGLIFFAIIGGLLYRQNKVRKATNAKLLLLNAQLDEANKTKAKFFAIISHDLRTPIARLANFLHLQKEAPDLLSKEQVANHQKKIAESADILLNDMEDLLLWSKGQMENFKPAIRNVSVTDLFKRIAHSFSVNDDISFSFEDRGNLTIVTDENFAYAILQNLTANSVKALYSVRGAKIEWKAIRKDFEIILSITDNGTGLSDVQEDQLLNTTEVRSLSKGFGFHIIRDLAAAIHCTISVARHADQGITFQLHFPIETQSFTDKKIP